MANNQRLGQWALNQAKAVKLHVTRLEWIGDFFPGFTDLQVKIEIDSKVFEGRGSDLDKDVALAKGLTEAIERFICFSNRITSLGVAGHYDFEKAKENAFLEFIERSLLSYHYENKIPMRKLSVKSLDVQVVGKGISAFTLHQFQMQDCGDLHGVFTLAEGLTSSPQFGGIMGASVSHDLHSAITKSTIECMRNVSALSQFQLSSLNIQDFEKIQNPTSEDSRRLLFNPDYCQNLLDIFSAPNASSSYTFPHLKKEQMKFEELKSSHPLLKDCPLVFVRCLDANGSATLDVEFVG
ncbi:MAG TPA: hypothetical protein PLU50_12360 [Pseudobdellovibrionaceae bacterium]|nr:hypothetical protein [Pseudobdellovibrionaceae bacterium]